MIAMRAMRLNDPGGVAVRPEDSSAFVAETGTLTAEPADSGPFGSSQEISSSG
jgi:hypothetical protein